MVADHDEARMLDRFGLVGLARRTHAEPARLAADCAGPAMDQALEAEVSRRQKALK